jgi:hypothetical protein
MNLPNDFISALYNYLSTKPYSEVAGFLKFIEVEDSKARAAANTAYDTNLTKGHNGS